MDDKDEKPREGNEASRPEVKSPGFVSGEGTKKVPKDKPKPYDPWAKATTTAGELSGVSPGYVYSVLCPRDFRGSALEDARKKLISDGYERDEQAFRRSLTELQKACKAYPVHRDNTPRF